MVRVLLVRITARCSPPGGRKTRTFLICGLPTVENSRRARLSTAFSAISCWTVTPMQLPADDLAAAGYDPSGKFLSAVPGRSGDAEATIMCLSLDIPRCPMAKAINPLQEQLL